MAAHWVLDQNFPSQIAQFPWPTDLKISSLVDIDLRLTRDHEDWQILLELHGRGEVDDCEPS